ncbi:MAG: glycosyltransferase family 2 protein, partial [Geminicoccaceae bacterium]
MIITLTVLALAIVIYHHAVYPTLLKFGSRLAQRSEPAFQPEPWPRITIIVPAYNEAHWIVDKIVNFACLDYPEDRL